MVDVTDEDRARAEHYSRVFPDIRLPEAFAAHRIAAEARGREAERAEIVAWLKTDAAFAKTDHEIATDIQHLAHKGRHENICVLCKEKCGYVNGVCAPCTQKLVFPLFGIDPRY